MTTLNIPDNSNFYKIKIGMSVQQVEDLIGKPTDQKETNTPRAYIPYYGIFAGDTTETTYSYINEGEIVFINNHGETSHFTVRQIKYNPSCTGYIN